MQPRVTAALTVLLLLLVAAPRGAAQDDADGRVFVQIDYMKIPEGGETEYLAVEREFWKPIHEERIRRGLMRDWAVLEARLTTPDSDYNYLTINVVSDVSALENAVPEGVVTAAHPDADFAAMMERTLASREIVHTEVWELVESSELDGAAGPGGARFEVLNFMTVPAGGEDEYVAAEREVWQPIHEARIDSGVMSGWGVYRLILPAGTTVHYNYLTTDFYADFGDYAEPIGMDLVQAGHAGATEADFSAMVARTNAARSIYKSEMWTVVEAAGDISTEVATMDDADE